jgi:hypothetical protein
MNRNGHTLISSHTEYKNKQAHSHALEVLKQVMDKKITRLTLMKRAGGAILPKVNLIDMRAEAGNALSAMLFLLCSKSFWLAFKIPLRFLSTCVAILFKALFFCCVLALRSIFAAMRAF